MKITIVSNSFSPFEGGATAIAFEHAHLLSRLGHEVSVFTTTADSTTDDPWLSVDNLKIYRLPTPRRSWFIRSHLSLRQPKTERLFRQFLAQIKPEIIHFHNLYYQLPFSLIKIARHFSDRVFFTAHDVMTFSYTKIDHFVSPYYTLDNINSVNYHLSLYRQLKQSKKAFNPLRNFIIRHYLRSATKIFAVSHELKKTLEQNHITNIEVIHNSIDTPSWQITPQELEKFQKESGLFTTRPIVLFAGRLSGYKGLPQIVAAMDKVIVTIPNARLLVLDSKNKKYSLPPFVDFLGAASRERMKYYYWLSNLVVVPSICFDSFPTVNLEAHACHRPVIATIFGGSRELIEHNKTGYLVNPLHINELTDKIIYLLTHPDIAQAMGESGFQKVKNDFNQDKWIQEILKWY